MQSFSPEVINIQYLENVDAEIFSISNQFSKKVSTKLAFTVVMRPAWSEEYFEVNEDHVIKRLDQVFQQFLQNLDPAVKVTSSQLKKWRYSHPQSTYSHKFEVLGKNKNIFIIGDAFGGGSIRGAIDSADAIMPSKT